VKAPDVFFPRVSPHNDVTSRPIPLLDTGPLPQCLNFVLRAELNRLLDLLAPLVPQLSYPLSKACSNISFPSSLDRVPVECSSHQYGLDVLCEVLARRQEAIRWWSRDIDGQLPWQLLSVERLFRNVLD
jgi:hypothetical protein